MGRKGTHKWKQLSAVLRCPFCRRYLVSEYVGQYKLRGATDYELAKAGVDHQPPAEAQTVLSHARTREDDDPPEGYRYGAGNQLIPLDDGETDEGAERGDGA